MELRGSSYVVVNPHLHSAEETQELKRSGRDVVNCARLSRIHAVRMHAVGPTIVLAADDSEVETVVGVLRRCLPELLSGSVKQHHWMVGALDLLVATTQEAVRVRFYLLGDVPCYIPASDGRRFIEEVYNLVDPETFILLDLVRFPRMTAPPSPPGIPFLNGMSSPGFGDRLFCVALSEFADGDNVLHQEESGILLFLPGILRGSMAHPEKVSMIMMAVEKAPAAQQDLELFVRSMNSALKVAHDSHGHMFVGASVDVVQTALTLGSRISACDLIFQFIVLDIEQLIEVPSNLQEIKGILDQSKSKLQLGIHSAELTDQRMQFIHQYFGNQLGQPLPSAKITLGGTQYYVMASDFEDKFKKLGQVQKVGTGRMVAVYCNTPEQVEQVATRMTCSTIISHTGLSMEERDVAEKNWPLRSVLVTDIYLQGPLTIINFELPDSSAAYNTRCGVDRNKFFDSKIINIVTSEEFDLLNGFCEELGLKVEGLM